MENTDEAKDKSGADQAVTANGEGSNAEVARQKHPLGGAPIEAGWGTWLADKLLSKPNAESVTNDEFPAVQGTAPRSVDGDESSTLARRVASLVAQIPGSGEVTDILNGYWEGKVRDKEYELKALEQQLKAAEVERRSQQDSFTDIVRSIVLLLVVSAIVGTPLVLILRSPTTPEQFAQYMAPITGIAGTIIGYWFGKYEPKSR